MTTPGDRHVCARCAARYRPRLTQGHCPLCGLDAPPGWRPRPRALASLDPDNRAIVLVLGATIGNLLVLAVVAVLLRA